MEPLQSSVLCMACGVHSTCMLCLIYKGVSWQDPAFFPFRTLTYFYVAHNALAASI